MFWFFFFSDSEPPIPPLLGFDVNKAAELEGHIRSALVPVKETKRNGKVVVHDQQYGIVKFDGKYFTMIAYRKAFDFATVETYHTVILDDRNRYYSVHVDVSKHNGKGKASFYPPHKKYDLEKLCFVDDLARQKFGSSEEW